MGIGGCDTIRRNIVLNPCAPIPTAGLVARYDFDGNANDLSGNNNHGTVNGATLANDRFGRANQAYSFNGVDNYMLFFI